MTTHPNNGDTQVDELDEILDGLRLEVEHDTWTQSNGNQSWQMPKSLVKIAGKDEAKAALLSWRDKHTAKMVREAEKGGHWACGLGYRCNCGYESDYRREIDGHVSWKLAQLTINSKEE